MEEHEVGSQLLRHPDALRRQLPMGLEEDSMGDAIVAKLLLLPRDDDGGLGGLGVVAQSHVQSEDVVGVFGHLTRGNRGRW